jgi:flagellar hook-associated protein 2
MSLNEVIGAINNAGAGVTASFDAVNQTFRIASIAKGDDAEVVLGETSGNLLAGLDLSAGTAQGADAKTTQFSVAVGDAAANLDTAVTSGTFTINDVTFSVNAATDTLQTILSRINASGAGVNASYDENSGKISLQQKDSGSENKIVLGAAGDTSNILYALKLSGNNPPVGGAPDTYSGQDAMVSVNGQAAQAVGSNSAQGLIPGVSVELLALGTVSITVQDDVDGMVDTIKDFVNQYNDIMNYINAKMDEERISEPSTLSEKLQGAFRSDSLFYQTKIDLAKIITDAVSGLPGTMNQMAQIGITTTSEDFGKAGTLELDEAKLRAALETNPDGVKNLFNDSGEGIMTQLSKKLDAYTNTVSGSFTTNATMIEDQVEYLSDRISDWEMRLEAKEKSLRMEFAAMESAIAQLNSMGNALANALGQNSRSSSDQ